MTLNLEPFLKEDEIVQIVYNSSIDCYTISFHCNGYRAYLDFSSVAPPDYVLSVCRQEVRKFKRRDCKTLRALKGMT